MMSVLSYAQGLDCDARSGARLMSTLSCAFRPRQDARSGAWLSARFSGSKAYNQFDLAVALVAMAWRWAKPAARAAGGFGSAARRANYVRTYFGVGG